MFTGLIETLGSLRSIYRGGENCRLTVDSKLPAKNLALGESIAVNGICLTVTRFGEGFFEADVSPETLERTTLGQLPAGARVNLERALRLGDRLGGHMVTGHVDGVGTVLRREKRGNAVFFEIEAPPSLLRYLVPKGSVAVDGISLTVNGVDERLFDLAIIPHSLAQTNLQFLDGGARVNLETDILGKYVERLLKRADQDPDGSRISLEFLAKNGYL